MEVEKKITRGGFHHERPGAVSPRCPDCGRKLLISPLNTHKRNVIKGLSCLVYCENDMGCGWIGSTKESVQSLVSYFISAGARKEVFDISRLDND